MEHFSCPNNFAFLEFPLTLELEKDFFNAKKQHLGLLGQIKSILVIAFKADDYNLISCPFPSPSVRAAQLSA